MKRAISLFIFIIFSSSLLASSGKLVWPQAPAQARIEFVSELKCESLKLKKGFFGSIQKLLAGKSDNEHLSLPFDLKVTSNKLFVVFQNIPALIEINRSDNSYKYHTNKKTPLTYPISIALLDENTVFVTDVENQSVYKLSKGKLKPFITENLTRPTGIAVLKESQRILIIDTGDHAVKFFDYNGTFIESFNEFGDNNLHFPTFTVTNNESIYINDGLNYKIKRFNADCEFISSFGTEGDSPGTFARPKGIALDSDGHIYVVDNLFDNVQIFDSTGQILLVIGSRGQLEGQFWSPAGIAIYNDTIFVADTYNNRIQIFHYLREAQ